MRSRLWAWLLGTFCLFGVLTAAVGVGTLGVPSALGIGIGWAVLVILVEFFFGRGQSEPSEGPARVRDLRPADGWVGLAALRGVHRMPASWDPRFGLLAGVAAGEPVPPRSVPGRQPPALLGRVVLFSIFLGRDGRSWKDRELAEAHRGLERAAVWIEREAHRHGAAVNLEIADTYIQADDEPAPAPTAIEFDPGAEGIEPFEHGKEVALVAATSRAVARLGLGFHDLADLIAAIEPRVVADERAWLLFPRSAGQSWAVSEADLGLPGVSLGVCYARETKFSAALDRRPFSDPVSIVHELLHLFGATDKYGVPLKDFPAGSVSRRDVMRLDFETLGALRVDPLTAAEIGWRGKVAGDRQKFA